MLLFQMTDRSSLIQFNHIKKQELLKHNICFSFDLSLLKSAKPSLFSCVLFFNVIQAYSIHFLCERAFRLAKVYIFYIKNNQASTAQI